MATTTTPRLGLKTQAAGDNPGTWEVDLNLGLLSAEDKFQITAAGDPNVALQADFIGQRYHDTDDDYWYTARDTAAPSDWVSDFETIDADVVHPTFPLTLVGDYPHGHLNAALEWLSITEVQLLPLGGNIIYYDDLGTRVTLAAGAFIFDITTDLEGAQTEDASTAYYLYMDNLTVPGVPEPVVSKTPPDDIGDVSGDGPGYHPTLASHRCVGSFWNNSSSAIAEFRIMRDGMVLFDSRPRDFTDHYISLNAVANAGLRNQTLGIPLTAEACRLQLFMWAHGSNDSYVVFAQGGAAQTMADLSPPVGINTYADADLFLQQDNGRSVNVVWEVPIVTRSAPAFRYGHNDNSDPQLVEAMILGYRDLWAPHNF